MSFSVDFFWDEQRKIWVASSSEPPIFRIEEVDFQSLEVKVRSIMRQAAEAEATV